MGVPELDTFRAKYPDYNDLPDAQLAGMLASKYPDAYGDLPSKVLGPITNGNMNPSPTDAAKAREAFVQSQSRGGGLAAQIAPYPAAQHGVPLDQPDNSIQGKVANAVDTIAPYARGAATGIGAGIGGVAGFASPVPGGLAAGTLAGGGAGKIAGNYLFGDAPPTQPAVNPAEGQGFTANAKEMMSNAIPSAINTASSAIGSMGDLSKAVMAPGGGQNFVNSMGQQVKNLGSMNEWVTNPVGNAATTAMIADPLISGSKYAMGKINGPTDINNVIQTGIEKGIRPGIEGNRTFAQQSGYMAKAQEAVKTIVANKDNLQLTDEVGEPTNTLPQNLKQFSQAIDQTKGQIFNEYDAMAKETGQSGAKIDLTPIADELSKVASNPVLRDTAPEVAAYAQKRANAYKGNSPLSDIGVSSTAEKTYTPEQAQNAITVYNQSLDAFYKNPSYDTASKAYIDSLVVNRLRKSLDDTIENVSGEGYQDLKNQYGALKSIEKDVNRRAIVDARRNTKGLIDFSDIFSGAEVVRGIMTMNPAAVATGTVAKIISSLYKLRNDPNHIVKGMFEKVENPAQPISYSPIGNAYDNATQQYSINGGQQ